MNRNLLVVYFGIAFLFFSCRASDTYGQTGIIKGTVAVKGIDSPKNVLVFLSEVPGEFSAPSAPVVMDTKQLEFRPSVLPILVGTKVNFNNRDRVKHNVMWLENKDGSYPTHNLGTWPKDEVREFVFDKKGSVLIGCKIHPEMAAHILVMQNPFFALLDEDGLYRFEGVPEGTYSIQTWYSSRRRLKPQEKQVQVLDGKTTIIDFSLSRR